MGFSDPFATPYFTGLLATSPGVPAVYDIAISGRGYVLDLESKQFISQTIPVQRAQTDTTNSPSEASLSREDLWRRAFESWHHGAGQAYRDRPTSDQYRFRSSRGMNVWDRDTLALLPDTAHGLTSITTNLRLATISGYLYTVDGVNVKFSLDGTAWSAATGLPGTTIVGMVTDGSFVYASDGVDVYRSTAGGAFASWNPLDVTLLAWVNGRLMASGVGATANSIYNIVSAAAPAALFNHPNANWTWTAFASGPTAIYAAGYAGDTSLIYRIPIKADGSGLDVPIVDFEMPGGELIYSMQSYLGYLAVGTSRGLRLMQIGDTLASGPPLPVGAVRCLEGQDRYMWFGWTNYDATHTGLGRCIVVPGVDSSAFTDTLTPAYATDLQAAAQGTVLDVVTWSGRRVFAVSGSGIWLESLTDLAPDATIDTGFVTFGLPDIKVLESIDLRMLPLAGTIAVSVAGTDGAFVAILPPESDPGETGATIPAHEMTADKFELRVAYTRGSSTTGPSLSRVTMLANPAPPRAVLWQFPILLGEDVTLVNNARQRYFAQDDRAFIALLADTGALSTIQVGTDTFLAFIEDFEWHPTHRYGDNSDWNGTHLVTVKVPSRRDN